MSIDPILEKCVHLQAQYVFASIVTILVSLEAILMYSKACGKSLL